MKMTTDIRVLKTRKGFINSQGKITTNISEAKIIKDKDFEFCDASTVYKKLGFIDDVYSNEVSYFILEPGSNNRIAKIAEYLLNIGYDNEEELLPIAYRIYRDNELDKYENYKKYINELIIKASEHFKNKATDETIILNNQSKNLHKKNYGIYQNDNHTEYKVEEFYYDDGEIYKYSFELKNPHIEKYFDMDDTSVNYYNNWQNKGIENYIQEKINEYKRVFDFNNELSIHSINNNNGTLEIYFNKSEIYYKYRNELIEMFNNIIRDFYSKKEMHITRMFGSYILLQQENNELKAVHTTPIPVKYCPLMIKLLKEVAGDYVDELLKSIETNNIELQEKCMCKLINETVIKSGYFDTNRPLNSCEANVLFGASETMSSAFKNDLIDAAVIVSNNLGTIITTNSSNTQGAVKRMTGLFYTTASKSIVDIAYESGIKPVFPITGKIDQLQGVKEAIKMGYKNIAVSVAASDNYLHKQLKELEQDGVKIYKFGLCSTGIDKETAEIMKDNADVVWSCASKYVKEIIEPNALAQVGIKIPVHIMTKDGWEIIKNHLLEMDKTSTINDIKLQQGDEKPVCLNQKGNIKVLQKKYIKKCSDCPTPCI